ncbi:sentrin-specific protease 7 isoform X1 [Esox lucius]|uniref:Ubiquitin-like protease family profile domain-containing protein n=1 Tax=Esox lucius TaxID=8010 RepID=A0AAY5KXP1_ESOLU|nr:sentrin-specific protease 7 isoform X1 [Esox lucius]
MMDHRRALTISLAVDKVDNSKGSPLKIPKTLRSSETGCGNEESQIHWTQIAGNRIKLQDSCQHNGSISLDPGLVATNCRQFHLVLTDVLKTEQGQAYLDRKRRSQMAGNGERRRESRLGTGQRRIPQSSKEAKEDGSTPVSTRRERRSHHTKRSEDEAEKELIIGEETSDHLRSSEDVVISQRRRSELTFTKADWHQEKPYPLFTRTRKSNSDSCESTHAEREDRGQELGFFCNGWMKDGLSEGLTTATTRNPRGSVLRLSRESPDDGGQFSKRLRQEGAGHRDSVASVEVEPVDVDETLMVVSVGEDGDIGGRERGGTIQLNLCSSGRETSKLSPAEPIVLSSDEEEVVNPIRSSVLRPQSGASECDPQRSHAQEENMEAERDSQVVPVMVTGFGVAQFSSSEDSQMGLSFSNLHCGGIWRESGGNLSITNQRIILPVKEPRSQVEVLVTVERCQLWRYSIWDKEDLQERGLGWESEVGGAPCAFLLLYVSDVQAVAVQEDLHEPSIKQALDPPTGQASPFLLLTLSAPLEGVEGALLRSVLDIICLNNTPHVNAARLRGNAPINGAVDLHNPLLSLDDSLVLIRRTGLDPQLLSLLGQNWAGTDQDQEPGVEDQDNTGPELETVDRMGESLISTETDPQTDPQTEEGHMAAEILPLPEDSPSHPRAVYTVCHRRTKDSYFVSLGPRPGSTWTRYTHQGPPRRLIQFPPPPSKGGITVTTEDLECLDNGQFLNDVIIDFYLKYLLLEKAPKSVAERSHVFSSFFYKQLTRRDNASEDSTSISAQQRRHQRVKNWTRHVDIFKKDFLFVPVNQESHWYLVVVCFPGLEEPQCEAWSSPTSLRGTGGETTGEAKAGKEASGSKTLNGINELIPESTSMENQDKLTVTVMSDGVVQGESVLQSPPAPLNCTVKTCQRGTVTKRPCIIIMDSLKFSLHERVFKLLREYLQSEWDLRRGSVREFSPEQLKGSHCLVPLQDNSSDCGLYLLQYVESFLQDPVVHFDLPLCLERWFPRQQVRRKRDEIRDLVLHLYRLQRGSVGNIGHMGNVVS